MGDPTMCPRCGFRTSSGALHFCPVEREHVELRMARQCHHIVSADTTMELTRLIDTQVAEGWDLVQCWAITLPEDHDALACHFALLRREEVIRA